MCTKSKVNNIRLKAKIKAKNAREKLYPLSYHTPFIYFFTKFFRVFYHCSKT